MHLQCLYSMHLQGSPPPPHGTRRKSESPFGEEEREIDQICWSNAQSNFTNEINVKKTVEQNKSFRLTVMLQLTSTQSLGA